MMKKAVIFDLYGTLLDFIGDETDPATYGTLSAFLAYHGALVSPERLRELLYEVPKQQMAATGEEYPEFDALRVFMEIIRRHGGPDDGHLAQATARLFRTLVRRQLNLLPGAVDVLKRLHERVTLGLVSNAQRLFAEPEMRQTGIWHFFQEVLISSEIGIRKPDPRLFQAMLDRLTIPFERCVFVGNDPIIDIYGASRSGMRTVLFARETVDLKGTHPDAVIISLWELEAALSRLLA